jgi:hypothetical protein
MSIQKRLIYMVLGGLLALSLFVGGFAVFAQSGEEGEAEETTVPEVESEPGAAENSSDESSSESDSEDSAVPGDRRFGFHGFAMSGDSEALAEAIGISVEELEAAYEAATAAAIEQAVEEGLLTEEQAEELSARSLGFHKGFGLHIGDIDYDALLADALGISVEELQEARTEVYTARLAEMVEAGAITQEEADLMLARKAVQDYIDTDSVSDALQAAYEAAVDEALDAGAITQEQADLMLENMPTYDGFGLGLGGGRGFHGPGGRGHGGHGFGGPANGFFAPSVDAPAITESSGA